MNNETQQDFINNEEQLEKHAEHYSDKKFLAKSKSVGKDLGFKALSAATTLFAALKSNEMSKGNKLIVLGALGYFIFPLDLIADLLPLVGLSDDTFIILAALAKVYPSITDEMKDEGKQMAEKIMRKK
jgi:uncharacterized membrane protein YkvA (DUF1232 family)